MMHFHTIQTKKKWEWLLLLMVLVDPSAPSTALFTLAGSLIDSPCHGHDGVGHAQHGVLTTQRHSRTGPKDLSGGRPNVARPPA